jgi:hypothetical protein
VGQLTFNLSHLGSRNWEDNGSRPVWDKELSRALSLQINWVLWYTSVISHGGRINGQNSAISFYYLSLIFNLFLRKFDKVSIRRKIKCLTTTNE